MHHPTAGSEPLHVALTKASSGAQRDGMVDQSLAHDRDSLKTAVRMTRKAGYFFAVVHAPAVLSAEILADFAGVQRRVGA